MKKTPETIRAKWDKKLQEIKKKREYQSKEKLAKLRDQTEIEYEKKMVKLYKKDHAYINKKEQEYKRKCMNEIRALEGKQQRVYKIKELTRNQKLQLALSIAQENAKLRDTNKDGAGPCISCGGIKTWKELAGGHLESRTIQGICLSWININAQCHYCNRTMGPKGSVIDKEYTKTRYEKNLIKRYGKAAVDKLKELKQKCIKDPKGQAPTEKEIENKIDELYEENQELRKEKDFYSPGSWTRVYKKYLASKQQANEERGNRI